MTGILQLLALVLDIFSRSGGPDLLKKWLTEKLPELQSIKDGLSGPNC